MQPLHVSFHNFSQPAPTLQSALKKSPDGIAVFLAILYNKNRLKFCESLKITKE